jgi:CDP-4-dehydro-6-deoxyglucose reductase
VPRGKAEKRADDVMVMKIKLPANERLQFLAGQYIDFQLKDGRSLYSLANPPHNDALEPISVSAGRPVHQPGVLHHERARHPAPQGPARQLLHPRGLRQADDFHRRRHRLRADQGHPRTRLAEHMDRELVLYFQGAR